MVNPGNVDSPKATLSLIAVIADGGANSYSTAFYHLPENSKLTLHVGARWNGTDKDKHKGHPVSRGKPIWFNLPRDIAVPYLEKLLKDDSLTENIKSHIEQYLENE